jgi:hypothetical protein
MNRPFGLGCGIGITPDDDFHTTWSGRGTVARRSRIPIEQRAETAVITQMRHETNTQDSMKMLREEGKRREVRRLHSPRGRSSC